MITRPLDLLSKLRPPPRNYDVLFLVNGGLIALFFALFGSNYVLSPGLAVDGQLQLTSVPAPAYEATPVSVSINASGQIWGDEGVVALSGLKEWLVKQAKRAPGTRLLVIMDTRASMEVFTQVQQEAIAAGFVGVHIAAQAASTANGPEVAFPK